MATNPNDKTLSALISDLTREMGVLVRDEIQLARTEMTEKAHKASNGVVSIAIGAGIAFASLLLLLWALTAGVAAIIEPWTQEAWVAPLIVGVVFAIIAWAMIQSGRRRLSPGGWTPRRTLHSLRRDRQVLRG